MSPRRCSYGSARATFREPPFLTTQVGLNPHLSLMQDRTRVYQASRPVVCLLGHSALKLNRPEEALLSPQQTKSYVVINRARRRWGDMIPSSRDSVELKKRLEEVRLLESRKSARLMDQDTDFARLADMAGDRRRTSSQIIDVPAVHG
uniref:Uncharacterized protein n=1 Tax=Timema monikensis TaxID=170555 RepID=A0A7R9E4J9_9NEOP|nr:unnamed protein product [Timema monikensis]